ncbi:proliferation-associated protein 2G4-like [Daphnia pulicaria]|uniref:proliferation-associated protein 2G4-like n=1 Tax=Daphnia pulicaria TaxID=35523 RepID=UPI001EEB812A|nr:proliferation-associated protein 2G4-like [Daphnia pulicaria]
MADKDKDEQEKTIAEDFVVTKYKMAGEISNRVIQGVIAQCVAGASVRELCTLGDKLLLEETVKVFKKEKELKKGIAFPTCVSVNNCVCHFSPLASDTDVELKDGDVVKIDLGAHVDGFIASVAHTVVVGSSPSTKITGRKADILLAAHYASEAALRLMKPGTENQAVTSVVQTIAESYKCKPIEGMLSHQLKQFEIDGEKSIIQNPNEIQRKEHEKSTFELHEVYAIDVLISSGEGVGKEMDTRTTVFKKTNETYMLKMKASRALFTEVNSKCGTMPFSLRNLEDEKKARMGVLECVSHKLLEPFHVLYEKPNEIVAQFKFTVLLMPNGPQKITGLPFDPTAFQTENSITDEEVKKLITSSTRSKPNKKKKPATTEVKKEAAPVTAN